MDGTHGNRPRAGAVTDDDDQLNSRERETAGELGRLDPHLAGLYERGLALVRGIDQPGNVYLLAHAGREVSRGVLELLLRDEGLEIKTETLDRLPENERNRASIAEALRLEPDDPRVDEWFHLVREFSDAVHWRSGGPQPDAVREAYERFSSLLYGRLAPYYITEADLDALLGIDTPTREHASRLRDLQLRPGQRDYFFRRLTNPGWVRYLTVERFFQSPPRRQTKDDGSWRSGPWPEGDYLVSAAADEPAAVLEVLRSIPPTNDNPVVWNLVAKAARKLPPEMAACIVPQLNDALKSVPTWIFTESVSDLVVFLAKSGREEAFDLAAFLLRVVDPSDVRGVEGVRFRRQTQWVFPCFVSHDEGELLAQVVGSLEALDAKRTLRLLLSKVQRIRRLAEDLDLVWDRRLAEILTEAKPDRTDVVAMVIGETDGLGQRLAVRGEAEASWVMELIDGYDADFVTRIGYLVLSEAGHHLQDRVDEILDSGETREPGYPATEIASLLRSQFRNASREARREYADAVEAGPSPEAIHERVRGSLGRDPTEGEIDDRIRSYQRRILTFFRGDIPEELGNLAERLGVLKVTPSLREQKLAEVGMYMGPSGWGDWPGDESPVSKDELARSSVDEIVTLLVEWRPGDGTGSSAGLRRTLTEYATANAGAALEVAGGAVGRGVDLGFLRAVLHGINEAVDAGSEVDWNVALAVVQRIVSRVQSLDLRTDPDVGQWRRTAGVAVRLLRIGCGSDSTTSEHADEVWRIIAEIMTASAIWDVAYGDDRSLGSTLMAELNDATGKAADAAISAALWDYRSRVGDEREASREIKAAARSAVQKQLVPLLDRWIEDDGPNSAVPRAVMGRYLPQLHLLAPEWIDVHAAELFENGLTDPASRPTWTTYISRCDFYDDVFGATRSWYIKAAKGVVAWRETVGDSPQFPDITQSYSWHLIVAFVRGLVSVGDEDTLLEIAYEQLHPSDWHRAYWLIFRNWSDVEEPPPADFVQRLLSLWEWRVSQLERNPDALATLEEAKELGWLFCTPHLPDTDRVRLGMRTTRLAQGQLQMYSRWDDMVSLAQVDPDGTYLIAEEVLRAELQADYPHVPVEDVLPFLAHVLAAGSADTQAHARSLINRLGERGYRLKDLLDETRESGNG